MQKAIKVLGQRVKELQEERVKAERIADEPEMLADYHFAMSDIANFDLEIHELGEAIKVLNNHKNSK